MNQPLLLTIVGLLIALVAMERLAARALRVKAANWHAHYAAIPASATITAELQWREATWITAYVDPSSGEVGSLQLVTLRPMTSAERETCLRWLHAEGFADASISRVVDHRTPGSRDSGA